MSLCRKIFEHCHFVQSFPTVDETLSKIQSDKKQFEFNVEKYFQHCHFVLKFIPGDKMILKIQSDSFHWATAFFYKNSLPDFEKLFHGFFQVLFVHRKTSTLKYWAFCPSICLSVRLTVCQSSVSHWNLQSFSEPSPGSGIIILTKD